MMKPNYSSDAPLEDPAYDQFNRYTFSQRIATVISERKDPSSIVIGIDGAWGEGKTSVLNFVEGELKSKEHIICLKFNPWRFDSEEKMLVNFFYDLASAVDGTIETGKEKVGEFIRDHIKPWASLFGQGGVTDGVLAFFPSANIEELKNRIENILKEEKKRIVILVDDIDRLDKEEIHAVFRLVKLTADFKYTAYIVAFDKELVSLALQDRYGSSNLGTGDSFLEKIIQVPLQLPAIDPEDLRRFCLNEIQQILNSYEIMLSNEEVSEFASNFTKGIEAHIKTPRQAKLYSNILMFSLPILKGEVNVVDLMLVEGIRVFLPNIYSLIKNNQTIFLNDNTTQFGRADEKLKKRSKEFIDEELEEFKIEEQEQIIDLLCFLFPKLEGLFSNVSYGNEWEQIWSDRQRICSPQYFQRYFSYAITKNDISDIVMNELLEYSELYSVEDTVFYIKEMLTRNNAHILVSKLRRLSKKFTSQQAKVLSVSIAKTGNVFPNPIQLLRPMNAFGQAAMFTGDCVEKIKDRREKVKLAKEILLQAESLSFATKCFRWFPRDTKERPNSQGFNEGEIIELGRTVAKIISGELKNSKIQLDNFDNFPFILYLWTEHGDHDEVEEVIKNNIDHDKMFVFQLLDVYTPTSFGETGAKKSSFDKNTYEYLTKFLDPIIIKNAIEIIYDDLKLDDKYPEYLEVPRDEELSRQFLWLYNQSINSDEKES